MISSLILRIKIFFQTHTLRDIIDNLKRYFFIIIDDVPWDTEEFILKTLKKKLTSYYEFATSDNASCEHFNDVADYFKSLEAFYKWLMTVNLFENTIEMESVKTYLYCLDLLEKIESYQFSEFDNELARLEETVSRLTSKVDSTSKLSQSEQKLIGELSRRIDEIERRCWKLLGKIFELRLPQKWWD